MVINDNVTVINGDCLQISETLPTDSVDAIITDPPYHLTSIVKRFGKPGSAEAKSNGATGVYKRASAGFMGKCYHPDTDVMTRNGWVRITDVKMGTDVATLNPKTRKVEWQLVEQVHSYMFSGNMVHVKHRSAEQLVTPNHKILVSNDGGKTLTLTEPLNTKGAFHLLSQCEPIDGTDQGLVSIGGKDRFHPYSFFYFLGLWLGDGYTVTRKNNRSDDFFGFNVYKQRKMDAIRRSLDGLGINYKETKTETNGKTTFYCYDSELLEFLKTLGKAEEKHIPKWMFDGRPDYLEKLYQGMIETDGCKQGKNQEVFYTSSRKLADDFQRLCFYTGRSAISIFQPGGKTVVINGIETVSSDSWTLSVLQKGKRLYAENSDRSSNVIYEVPYSGKVYCVGVPEHHIIYTRFNGKPVWSGNSWDGGDIAFNPETWREFLRVLKPGGYLLAFAAPRNQHRMIAAIEEAGFEIVDLVLWVFGSGFPKSHNVGKAIEGLKNSGNSRFSSRNPKLTATSDSISKPGRLLQEGGARTMKDKSDCGWSGGEVIITDEEAKKWAGYGTALKPSFEPILCARKPENGSAMEITMADRINYFPKASKKDRKGSKHPTVKPIALMRKLVTLVSQPGDTILDPFAGTGSTGEAAYLEGRNAILIEREEEYYQDIIRRFEEYKTSLDWIDE